MTPLIIITAYLCILLVLGVSSNRLFKGTSLDYLLASHSIGPFLLLMSLFGTTMTAFSLVGSTGYSFVNGIGVYGLMASSSALLHPLCFYFVGLKVWSLGSKYGYTTQIEFFQDRLESRRIAWVLFPVAVGLIVPYVLIGILGGGFTIQAVTDIPARYGSLIICGVVLTYVFLGGMRGTAWANAFQTIVFMGLGVITFVVLVKGMGGEDSFLASLQSASASVDASKLSRVNMPHSKYFAYLLIPLSIGMFPHIFQHWLTARNAAAFKLPIIAHPLFVLIVWAPCVLIGTWAAGDTEIVQLVDDKELKSTAILGFLVNKHSGEILSGLLTAGILAAIMSSLDSQFLCLGTMFTRDVLGRRATADADDGNTVFMARGFVVAVVAVCYGLSLVAPGGVFALGIWCFSGFSGLFPLIIAALYWRGLTKAGAYAAVLVMAALWFYMFQDSGFGANPKYSFLGLHQVVVLVGATSIAMLAVSLLTPGPSTATLDRFFKPNAEVPSPLRGEG
jgi:SSS family solute:Na+ symporter